MRVILDTHTFPWLDAKPDLVPAPVQKLVLDPESECLLPISGVWEMAIKIGIGKLSLRVPLVELIESYLASGRFKLLRPELRHLGRVSELPRYHGDPFDRLMVAMALEEGMPVVSNDRLLDSYGVHRIWS